MKANRLNLWLAISLLLAAGCGGARTPLDELESVEPGGPAGGGGTALGGGTGFGGSVATGGISGAAGWGGPAGATADTGGATIDTGGVIAPGGFFPFGGTAVVGGYIGPTGGMIYLGGRGGGAGTGPVGGTLPLGGTVGGGRGGGAGTAGTTVVGGRGGGAGTLPLGGSVVGGHGGTAGAIPLGGSAVGGHGGTAGAIPLGGSVVGGHVGTGGAGGTVVSTTCPGLASNEELIDDMNDGDRFIPQVNGRAGAWKDSDDGTPGSTMFPDPAGPFTMTNTGDACRKYAAYAYGGPFVDNSPVVYFGIGGPYDASKYSGISFWAKYDSGTSANLRVAFPDKDTQPDGGLCKSSVPGNQCWDHYGKRIGLTTTWTKYDVFFNETSQDGWGRTGGGFDRSTIYEVQFQLPIDAKFGIWIDDVAFVIGLGN